MSTKIYNAFKLGTSDMIEVINTLNDLKKVLYQKSLDYYSEVVWRKSTIYVDKLVNGEEEYLKPLDIKHDNVFDYYKKLLMMNNKKVAADEATSLAVGKKPDYDLNTSVSVIPTDQGYTLFMFFTNNAIGLLDDKTMDKFGFRDYHYQNSTDRPDNISEEEWLKRERDWGNYLKTGIPSNHGLLKYLVQPTDFGYIRHLKLNPKPLSDELRFNTIAVKKCRKEYYKNNPVPEPTITSDYLQTEMNYRGWLNTDEGIDGMEAVKSKLKPLPVLNTESDFEPYKPLIENEH